MATTNPVNQVLVTSGDQALLAAGSRPSALAVGQLGIFNFHTGLSIDGSVPADARDIVIMVGIDPNGVGSLQDVNRSAGQMIQVRHAKSFTYKGTTAAVAKIIDLAGFTAKCEADYAIKIEFRNGQIYAENGYNQFTKTFNFRTGCCVDQCEPCADGDCTELAQGLVNQINADPDGLVIASYFANLIVATINGEPTADGNTTVTIGSTVYTVAVLNADTTAQAAQKIVDAINNTVDSPYRATLSGSTISVYPKVNTNTPTGTFAVSGSGVTANAITEATKTAISDIAAFIAAYPGVCPGIRLTSVPMPQNSSINPINIKYVKNRTTDMIVSTPEGFVCNGTIVTVQEGAQQEGSGYDIMQLEYIAGGWNGKPGPYRLSTTTGMAREGIVNFASASANYNQFVLTYDQMSVGGWEEYLNNLETIIAVPCADTTTTTSLAAILDLIFTQFGAMANDVAANDGCTNVRTGLLTPATDGIESLA